MSNKRLRGQRPSKSKVIEEGVDQEMRSFLLQDDKFVDVEIGHGLQIRAIGCVYLLSKFYIARYFLHFIIELKSQMHLLLPRSSYVCRGLTHKSKINKFVIIK